MNNLNEYLLTVAIPTYKRPKYLIQAIDSAVNQNDKSISYEIIVVNNDTESDMAELIKKYENADVPIKFITNEKNLGMLGNVNRCLELAKGKYIAFLHDDDLLLSDYLHTVGKVISSEKEYACLIPQRYMLFENNERSSLETKRKIKRMLLGLVPNRYFNKKALYPISVEDNVFSWQNCYGAPSCGVIFNKSIVKKYGLFFPEGTFSWDFISFMELNRHEEIYIIPQVLSVYRMTSGASIRKDVQLDFFKVYEQLRLEMQNNITCSEFVKTYKNEIAYLNYSLMSDDAVKLAKKEKLDLTENIKSHLRYFIFMVKRLSYWSGHHLDVECPIDRKGKEALQNMGVIDRE